MIYASMGVWLIYGAITLAVAIALGIWKGRIVAAIVWSAVLGPIGWIIVALGPNLRPITSAPCPHCGGVVPVHQRECKHCKGGVVWIQGKARKASRAAA
jgi:hypothetical protein